MVIGLGFMAAASTSVVSNFPSLVTDLAVRFRSDAFSTKNPPVSVVFSGRRSLKPNNAFVVSNSTEVTIRNKEKMKIPRTKEIVKNPSLICAPLMANSIDKMVIEMFKAHELGADLVEIRLDALTVFNPLEDLKTIIQQCPLPTLFTYRPKWEGGHYEGNDNERQDVLRLAMELGANYVDIEFQVASEFIKSIHGKKPENFKVVVSSHNYNDTPSVEDLKDLVARIQQTGADIVKIVTTAVNITDVARLFHITSNSQVPTIGLAMGERGLISWILSSKFGGYLTYATLESEKMNAHGQPTVNDLLDLYNFRQIGTKTKVYGVVGNPISHSRSPLIYNRGFKTIGYDGVYIHMLADNIASFLGAYSSLDFVGFSCAIPYKEDALKCCDEVDPLANSVGAVNTIRRRESDGKLLGYNTDCYGAISAIEDGLRSSDDPSNVPSLSSPLAGKTVVIIGAGGAGRALAYGAKEKGANVFIANRTYERAVELADSIGGKAISLADIDDFHQEDGMILVNTTSMGMQPNVDLTPISKHALKHYSLVFDAVYTPKMTRLLREAEESGAKIVVGSEMFVRQALEQFELLTDLPAPEELFRQIMTKY
ncbi:PREDICTED: bifunctional 3-dehydroquinate dehydratase/shikimate dehydrogenase, chloroplastic isoform X2 [Camelina sativa]|uniref:shikimate dehydrogenase (NADP(+)) n=1 Tax=Camelina sativa TaxID=90675 RepID=A0ABM0XHN4_CAMSA|nr:PREDICTED: bifunctional 3-dehydroquinate dehydratase/shikimate dehydrogenase, chloroplastic isoform X1 [Camelina sativa]XP_019097142.1 PREDICTED: bifunctional 3-dehydroquinate dehydratase/shikimate dehydrogenase, chloroplastic isoform X2 [Camelina sativa]